MSAYPSDASRRVILCPKTISNRDVCYTRDNGETYDVISSRCQLCQQIANQTSPENQSLFVNLNLAIKQTLLPDQTLPVNQIMPIIREAHPRNCLLRNITLEFAV